MIRYLIRRRRLSLSRIPAGLLSEGIVAEWVKWSAETSDPRSNLLRISCRHLPSFARSLARHRNYWHENKSSVWHAWDAWQQHWLDLSDALRGLAHLLGEIRELRPLSKDELVAGETLRARADIAKGMAYQTKPRMARNASAVAHRSRSLSAGLGLQRAWDSARRVAKAREGSRNAAIRESLENRLMTAVRRTRRMQRRFRNSILEEIGGVERHMAAYQKEKDIREIYQDDLERSGYPGIGNLFEAESVYEGWPAPRYH